MKLVHRAAFHATGSQRKRLEESGIRFKTLKGLPKEKDPFIWFDVSEDVANWPIVQKLLEKWGISTFLRTEYSKTEIGTARWLEILSDWHHGFPQPDQLWDGYLEATFDLRDYCATCGIGLKQEAPFQMKGEPRWGKRSILQMNWVFDEYFVTPEVWINVFESHGIASRPVTNTKGSELQTVVQLVVLEEVGIETKGLPGAICPECGRMKYLPVTRGPLPPMTSEPSTEMAKTEAYFGDGGSAFRKVIVSHALYERFTDQKIRGASFAPVAGR